MRPQRCVHRDNSITVGLNSLFQDCEVSRLWFDRYNTCLRELVQQIDRGAADIRASVNDEPCVRPVRTGILTLKKDLLEDIEITGPGSQVEGVAVLFQVYCAHAIPSEFAGKLVADVIKRRICAKLVPEPRQIGLGGSFAAHAAYCTPNPGFSIVFPRRKEPAFSAKD